MEKDVRISPMKAEDVLAVSEIEKLCFAAPWSLEAFRMEIESNRCAKYLVAKEGLRVIGYGGMWLILDEAHITNIAVHPEYRGRGIGERLMRELMGLAHSCGIQRMTLEVRKSNWIAQRLYQKLGFEVCGVRKKYYANNNEDALIMWNNHIGDDHIGDIG